MDILHKLIQNVIYKVQDPNSGQGSNLDHSQLFQNCDHIIVLQQKYLYMTEYKKMDLRCKISISVFLLFFILLKMLFHEEKNRINVCLKQSINNSKYKHFYLRKSPWSSTSLPPSVKVYLYTLDRFLHTPSAMNVSELTMFCRVQNHKKKLLNLFLPQNL